jgi:glycosyltransferase involved in cell wall biosynthesis
MPALNEATNLPHVFANLPHDVHEVVLVDGNSTDDTVPAARRLRPDVKVVVQSRLGKGNALACGFASCKGDIIVTIDADGSADAAEIPRFVAALRNGADLAMGSRFLNDGGSDDITPARRLGNRILTALVNAFFGTRYTDLCYGYNAFWSWCLDHISIDCDGFEIETFLRIRAAKAKLVVQEVPSHEYRRIHGESNLHTIRDGWRVLRIILAEHRSRTVATGLPALPTARYPSQSL